MSDSVRDLLTRGIAAAKAGEKSEARRYLEWALRLDPTYDQCLHAWYYLSQVCDDPAEKRGYLETILLSEPNDPQALRALAILDGRLSPSDIVDPDRLPAASPPAGGAGAADAQRFACPRCGGRMVYTPDGSALTCEYCEVRDRLTQGHLVEGARPERDFVVALATQAGHTRLDAAHTVTCQSCGASFELAPGALTAACPYCASVYVIQQQEGDHSFSVEALIPFAVSREMALQSLKSWLIETGVRGKVKVLALRGFYLPAWLFTISSPVPKRKYQENGHPLYVTNFWGAVLIPASQAFPLECYPALDEFDLSGLTPFDPAYLADWEAETYQVSLSDASLAARFAVREKIQVPGDLDTAVSSMQLVIESFRLVLLPLWSAQYRITNRRAQASQVILINGQNGKIFPHAAPLQPTRR
jgi:predicted RNA-binding Zn-ribbon protein involved in translation (DUF1610 family)